MAKERPVPVVEGILVLLVLGLVAAAATIGVFVGRETKNASSAPATVPGHEGVNLAATDFGDPAVGSRLFVSQGCADCHSYAGQGGEDAPPLDFMAGHLSAREVANMSGRIWNHLPAMLMHFEEEGLPVPTFEDDQMADLVAFLHSEPASAPAETSP